MLTDGVRGRMGNGMKQAMSQRGFTIVELLIVIVVIGILAAITVVAFNGVQQRAQNIQRITAAKEWQKLITSYVAVNNSYPLVNGYHNCLGSGNVTNWDADPNEDCGWSNNVKHPSSTMTNAFATMGIAPSFPAATLQIASGFYGTGISLRASETLDPSGTPKASYPTLLYWLAGVNQDCVLRPVVTYVSGGIALSSTAISSGNDGPNATQCRIALPDPYAL